MSAKYEPAFADPHNSIIRLPGQGEVLSVWQGVPTAGAAGYIKGHIAINAVGGIVYVNTGTTASATWSTVTVS